MEFQKVKAIEMPRDVVAGHGVIDDVRDICEGLHFAGAGTIITGGKTAKVAGSRVKDLMEGYDMDVCMVGDATIENAELAAEQAREFGSSFILAVGGGSKIDLAKIVSNELRIPFIAIPTSASHDGIASNRASLKSADGSSPLNRLPRWVSSRTRASSSRRRTGSSHPDARTSSPISRP